MKIATVCGLLRNGRSDTFGVSARTGLRGKTRFASLSWGFARNERGEVLPRTPQEGSAPS